MNLLTPGERVDDLIKERGSAATRDAEKMGIAQSTLSDFINGKRCIRSDTLKTLCEYYNVSADYILGLSDVETRNETIQGINKETNLSEEAIAILITEKVCGDSDLADFISFIISQWHDVLLLRDGILKRNKCNQEPKNCYLDVDGKDIELELGAIFKTYAEELFWKIASQYKVKQEDQ